MKDKLLNNYLPEIHSLLKTLNKHGLHTVRVDNGDGFEWCKNDEEAAGLIDATDESWVIVEDVNKRRGTLFVVLGNGTGEIVADWSGNDVGIIIDAVVGEHYAAWEGVEQPKILSSVKYHPLSKRW